MAKNEQKGLPPVLERYELKFTIPFDYVEPISQFVAPYCTMDKFSVITPGNFYRVNNLYLDSPNFLFLKKRMDGADNRFNMRVRSYGDDPSMPYFVEIKQKKGNIIKKYRAKVTDPEWFKVYTEPGFTCREQTEDPEVINNLKLFERLIYSYNVSPKILTQYVRKAWVSDIDDYARVTFDIDLKYMEENSWNLIPDQNRLNNYDNVTAFDSGASVVLELKCYTSAVPYWMIDLIREFSLKRRSFSKYLSGARELFEQNRYFTGDRKAVII